MLETRVKNGETTLEFVRDDVIQVEKDGKKVDVNVEVYRARVTKDNGRVADFFEIPLPATIDDARKMLADETGALELIQKKMLVDEQNRIRTQVLVSDSEKEEKAKKLQSEVQKTAKDLQALGIDKDQLKQLLGF